jgi:hypothetical protein
MKYVVEGQDVERATEVLMTELRKMYGETVRNVVLDHVDAAGYWFSYELVNDDRRQVCRIKHSELEG